MSFAQRLGSPGCDLGTGVPPSERLIQLQHGSGSCFRHFPASFASHEVPLSCPRQSKYNTKHRAELSIEDTGSVDLNDMFTHINKLKNIDKTYPCIDR